MSRPLPAWPRGPRRARATHETQVLGCPRISPEWELSMITALMRPKPATRGRVEHRDGVQPAWAAVDRNGLEERHAVVAGRLGVVLPPLQWPAAGEYACLVVTPTEQEAIYRAVTAALSVGFTGRWFVLGRHFVRDGRFYRRRRGYQLELVHAADVHLDRELRRRLGGLLRPAKNTSGRGASGRSG